MHGYIRHIVQWVLFTTSANVPILVAVSLETTIDGCQQAEAAEVKLALVDKQRVVDVLLNNEGAVSIFLIGSANDRFDFLNSLDDRDSLASVRVLTRLDDPCVLRCPVLFPDLLDSILIFIWVDLATVVVILGTFFFAGHLLWFFWFLGQRFSIFTLSLVVLDRLFDLFLRLLEMSFNLIVVRAKLAKFWIVDSLLGVESEWQDLGWIWAEWIVVFSHVDEETLLISQLLVLLQFVIEAQWEYNLFELDWRRN